MLKSRTMLAVLIIIVAALAAGLVLWRDDSPVSLSAAVERSGSRVLGTRVDVESADVDWESGAVSVKNLQVANPGGFSDDNMITVASAGAEGDLPNGVIERLTFDGIQALIEFRGASSNFEEVSGRAADNTDGPSGPDNGGGAADDGDAAAEEDQDPSMPEDWRVEHVSFDNIEVTVRADWTGEVVTYEAGGLTLENLDGRLDDLTRRVVVGFLGTLLATGAEQVDNSRLRESLLERAGALRDEMREADEAAQ